jgi:hypothetical protein
MPGFSDFSGTWMTEHSLPEGQEYLNRHESPDVGYEKAAGEVSASAVGTAALFATILSHGGILGCFREELAFSGEVGCLLRKIGVLSGDFGALSGIFGALSGGIGVLSGKIVALSGDFGALLGKVGVLSGGVGALSGDFRALTGNFLALSGGIGVLSGRAERRWRRCGIAPGGIFVKSSPYLRILNE